MELTVLEASVDQVRAGYACPCGCTPSVGYTRGADVVEAGCCCGNRFAIGRDAATRLSTTPGFRAEQETFDAPWGERLRAAWLIGPSTHGPSASHDNDDAIHQGHGQDQHHSHIGDDDSTTTAVDPVCGMTIDPATAGDKGLTSTYKGTEYFFCSKGCKLDFEDDPERYLDPTYVPSM